MKCNGYGRDIPENESYDHQSEALCGDCYLNIRLEVRACDPWAVYSATQHPRELGD